MWDSRDATQVVDPAMAIFRFLDGPLRAKLKQQKPLIRAKLHHPLYDFNNFLRHSGMPLSYLWIPLPKILSYLVIEIA